MDIGCILVLVQKDHYILAEKLLYKTATKTAEAMSWLLSQFSERMVKSVTPDQETEFFYAKVTEQVRGVPFYFPQPHDSWMRPTSENTNGLICQYASKRKDFRDVSDDDVCKFLSALNFSPRKCLGWKSPHETFFNKSLHLTGQFTVKKHDMKNGNRIAIPHATIYTILIVSAGEGIY